jgi:alpha-tubulin suppressor-like RCC1 family protein
MRTLTRRGLHSVLALAGGSVLVMVGAAAPAVAAPSQGDARPALQALAPPSLFTWGYDQYGQLGNGQGGGYYGPWPEADIPISISLPAGVRQASASGRDDAAVLADGRLATWGYNFFGQIGDGTTILRTTPVVVAGLTGITQVADGETHMLALDSAGKVWSWGSNLLGALGNGTTSQVVGSNPTPVPVPGLTAVTQIAAGTDDSFALRSDGTVWAWGINTHGQLGDGTTVNRDSPERVPGLAGIKKIFAGAETCYAIRADGSVLAWGNNPEGLLGNGTATGFSATPVAVPGLTGVTQLSASDYEALAVAGPAGAVWAWGANNFGASGDGTTTPHYTPEQIGLSGVSQVAAGDKASVAALANGSVMTWGEDDVGELGIGGKDTNAHPSPVLVRTLAGVSQVSAGGDDVMAVGSPAPRIPSVIDDTQSEAAERLQEAGYVLGRVAVVVDVTCEYIGVVKTQTPPAGTIDPPGTSVSVTIGKAGGKCI